MKVGLIGESQSGKTTLFCALTGIKKSEHQFTAQARSAIVKYYDERLDELNKHFGPKNIIYPAFELVDFQAIELDAQRKQKNAERIAQVREVDAILIVINQFQSETKSVAYALNKILSFQTEFILSDLSILENRIQKLHTHLKKPSKTTELDKKELDLLEKFKAKLENVNTLKEAQNIWKAILPDDPELRKVFKAYAFLFEKYFLVFVNISENQIEVDYEKLLSEKTGLNVISCPLKLEVEILELSEEERKQFMSEYNLKELKLNKLPKLCLETMNVNCFFTIGRDEMKEWLVPAGECALNAAGRIHTDMAKGFISAEVTHYNDLLESGMSFKNAKERGKTRLEGKNYIVKDGDIITFRFNV